MAISERLKAFLSTSKARYTTMKHPVVYTAQEIAAAQHVPGRQMAKCVLIKTDQAAVLAVLSAAQLVDFKKLKAVLGSKSVSLGKEADIKQRFPDVEVGAMSPFGNLYDVPVVMDRELAEAGDIVFNGGTHTETVKMSAADVVRLVKPKLGVFGLVPAGAKTGKGKASAKKKAAVKGQAKRQAAPKRKVLKGRKKKR